MLILYLLRKRNDYLPCVYLHGITPMSAAINCFASNKITFNFFNVDKIYAFCAAEASNYKMSIIIKNTFINFGDYCKYKYKNKNDRNY